MKNPTADGESGQQQCCLKPVTARAFSKFRLVHLFIAHRHTRRNHCRMCAALKFLGSERLCRCQANRPGVASESKWWSDRERWLQSWQAAPLAGPDGNEALIGTECEASETWEGHTVAALLITRARSSTHLTSSGFPTSATYERMSKLRRSAPSGACDAMEPLGGSSQLASHSLRFNKQVALLFSSALGALGQRTHLHSVSSWHVDTDTRETCKLWGLIFHTFIAKRLLPRCLRSCRSARHLSLPAINICASYIDGLSRVV